jgi:hypothetical protein
VELVAIPIWPVFLGIAIVAGIVVWLRRRDKGGP